MGSDSLEHHPVAETVAGNRKFFWVFCLAGLVLVLSGLFSLRMDKRIRAAGVVMAAQEHYVFAPASGVISRHLVRIGDEVSPGTPLFSIAGDELDMKILEKQRQILEVREQLSATELALRESAIRPGDPAIVTAQTRLDVLREIEDIQHDIVAAWERLEGERAVRGLEYNLQRVASLRTQIEKLDSGVLAQWEDAGLLALSREGMERKKENLRELEEVLEDEIRLLKRQREAFDVRAPMEGTVVDIYHRYPGMSLQEGDRVMKIADPEGGFRVKAFVGERNVDLLRVGTEARMESQVFDALFEGYVTGKVQRVVAEARRDADGREGPPAFEVTVAVEETPHPLVLGSRVEIDFLLGRQSLLALLMNRPTDDRIPPGRGRSDPQ